MIESSIQRDGFGRSILLANDGTVIAGNATMDAAASAGLDDVIVVETDGTKVIAAEQLNRTCYGMEIDPHYCDVIVKRWEDFTGQKAALDG